MNNRHCPESRQNTTATVDGKSICSSRKEFWSCRYGYTGTLRFSKLQSDLTHDLLFLSILLECHNSPKRPCLVKNRVTLAQLRWEECAGVCEVYSARCIRHSQSYKTRLHHFRHHCHVQLTEVRNVHLMLRLVERCHTSHTPHSGKRVSIRSTFEHWWI